MPHAANANPISTALGTTRTAHQLSTRPMQSITTKNAIA